MYRRMTSLAFALALAATPTPAQEQTSPFTPEYIEANRGTEQYLTTQGYELANVILTLTPLGMNDERLFTQGDYYDEVMAHFAPYADHPLIARLGIETIEDVGYFLVFRENGAYWEFDGDKLVLWAPHRDHWGNAEENLFAQNIELIEDFARQSDFRAFYEAHRPYYEELESIYPAQIPLTEIVDWLERRFGTESEYDSYKVFFSPLVGASNSASRLVADNYAEAVMMQRVPDIGETNPIEQAYTIRGVFTEVDHHFVNPLSERMQGEIDNAITDFSFWNDVDKSAGYETPFATFNEYMTWSLFSLWARDTYDEPLSDHIIRLNRYSMIRRGFPHFAEFDVKLLEIVPEDDRDMTMQTVYPQLLAFMRDYHAEATGS